MSEAGNQRGKIMLIGAEATQDQSQEQERLAGLARKKATSEGTVLKGRIPTRKVTLLQPLKI